MIQASLLGLAILAIGLVGLFLAVVAVLAVRSGDEAMPRALGTMDLAGATGSPRAAGLDEGAVLARSLSSLHRRLPSPASAMEGV